MRRCSVIEEAAVKYSHGGHGKKSRETSFLIGPFAFFLPHHDGQSLAQQSVYYLRPIFDQGDLVAVDLTPGGFITADYAKKLFERFGAVIHGKQIAPCRVPEQARKASAMAWSGGLPIRGAKFDIEGGRMHLRTETGMEFGELASNMAEWPKNLAPRTPESSRDT